MRDDWFRRLLRDIFMLERDLLENFDMGFDYAIPGMQMRETESYYIITIPLPGVRKEDINLYLDGNNLVIDVHSKAKEERKEKNEYFVNVGEIHLHREIPLPANADPNSIEAEYRNGLLVIRIKKTNQFRGRRIPIK
ncbi:NEQ344 [Nanoarchaeum equitans Kin4-M]|uniref:NEQ344 n=1 Tax=Nanoarchaeum equitans (strain Kin4-M) TaxID=228908 RepID=Q74MA9_NANEQ|nr:NEQ344 [Nanoarchaeum equitans Kin4-M]